MTQISQKLIAIVDDDQAMRESISDYLNRANYRVKAYSSGEVMLAEAFDLDIGVIICDLKMPGMSGIVPVSPMGILASTTALLS